MTNQLQRSPIANVGGLMFGLLALGALSGCLANHGQTYDTAIAVQSSTTLQNDPYQKTNWIRGPEVYCAKFKMCVMFLRASVLDRGAMVLYQVYVHDDARGWRFYERAYDGRGDLMNFVSLDRRTRTTNSSVKAIETFVIDLGDAYMNRAKAEGLAFKAVGSRGDKIFTLPPHYVQGFMSAVDAQRF